MIDLKAIDALARRLTSLVPPGVSEARLDLERNFRTALQNGLSRLDLVSREEFDIQRAILQRTRNKVDALESLLIAIEARLAAVINNNNSINTPAPENPTSTGTPVSSKSLT